MGSKHISHSVMNSKKSNSDERVLEFSDFKTSVKEKSMWLGSTEVTTVSHWMRVRKTDHTTGATSNVFRKMSVEISEALVKVFDEILVNAIDQYVATIRFTEAQGGPVTVISVSFDNETGEITVTNTGQGIPIYQISEHKDPGVIGKWSVQLLISREFSGSGGFAIKDPDQVTGSINGLGMKLININCQRFEIETVDWPTRRYYKQVCEDRMDRVNEPIIVDLNDKVAVASAKLSSAARKPHTTVRFLPAYEALCRGDTSEQLWFGPQAAKIFSRIIEFRLYQTAAFISCISYRYKGDERIGYDGRKAAVYFNDDEISIPDLATFTAMFDIPKTDIVSVALEQSASEVNAASDKEKIRFPWYITIAANPFPDTERISIINGLFVPQGGSHIDMIVNQIMTAIQPKIDKLTKQSLVKIQPSVIKNALFTIDCKQIPVPQFSSQTKAKLTLSAADLVKMRTSFIIPQKSIDKIWALMKNRLEAHLITKEQLAEKKTINRTPIRKYEKAARMGPSSLLFIPEGDSAQKPIRNIIHSGLSELNYKRCGIYNCQGVPLNALKQTTSIEVDGQLFVKKKKSLKNNVGLQDLVRAVGLDWDEDYYFGPPTSEPNFNDLTDDEITALYKRVDKGTKAFESLNYGAIVIATDQDLDGVGQICSLLLVFIFTFWPELIKRGFVKRLVTPLIRVYNGQNVESFYSEHEFIEWANANHGGAHNLPKHSVRYYKGLSSHSKEEVLYDMGANIMKNIHTFLYDTEAPSNINAFYGSDTSYRKVILTTPVTRKYNASAYLRQFISCSDHLLIEAKAFQLDFTQRKLKSAVDGFIPVQRKAFAGARKYFTKTKDAKVYQFTGYIAQNMRYAHGDASMNEAVTKMAQSFTGSNNIPPFKPVADGFGDRVNGRGSTGGPRYIDLGLNKKIMNIIFPPDDDWVLPYVFEEGVQCEPIYYVPIVPYAILETSTTASVGWKIGCWARRSDDVLRELRAMISGDIPAGTPRTPGLGKNEVMTLRPWLAKGMTCITGRLRTGRVTSEICIGSYKRTNDDRRLIITQLPLKCWSYNYKCSLLGINPENGKEKGANAETPTPKKRVTKAEKEAAAALEKQQGHVSRDCIVEIMDHTANDKNNIIIDLKPGSLATILADDSKYGNEFIDPIQDYFELAVLMQPLLNMIISDGSVKEFGTYEEVFRYWYPMRKQMYIDRIKRQIILKQLHCDFYTNQLRYIKMETAEEINIDDKEDDERESILLAAGFAKFRKSKLFKPQYISDLTKLEALIRDPALGASYKYIDQITIGMKSKKKIAELQVTLDKELAELERLKGLEWYNLWLDELDNFEKTLKHGIETEWWYNKPKPIFKQRK